MGVKFLSQHGFPSLLYDTLFGLILFFGLDSFLEIRDGAHFAFYGFATIIIIHWWLMFKAADDIFTPGVRDTAVHIAVNILYVILLEFMSLHAASFRYVEATSFLILVLLLDILWAAIVLRAGRWKRAPTEKAAMMRTELKAIIRVNGMLVLLLAFLAAMAGALSPAAFVAIFIVDYLAFIILTFKEKIIDLPAF